MDMTLLPLIARAIIALDVGRHTIKEGCILLDSALFTFRVFVER